MFSTGNCEKDYIFNFPTWDLRCQQKPSSESTIESLDLSHVHISTRLTGMGADTEGILVDTGAFGNINGDRWRKRVEAIANKYHLQVTKQQLDRTLSVGGISAGGEPSVRKEKVLSPIGLSPIAMDGTQERELGVFKSPEIPDSDVPGIWGLDSLKNRRALVDTGGDAVILPGPGGFEAMLSPGSQVLKCGISTSGHMLVPCTNYKGAKSTGAGIGPFKQPTAWISYGGAPAERNDHSQSQ